MVLPPFPSAIWDLRFEELEGIETELGLGDFESATEDGAGFVLHQE